MEWIKKFFKEEEGTETVEWAILAGLLLIVAVGAWGPLGTAVNAAITAVTGAITGP